uniref:Uncharacterized protein n=1 Tax=Arundo donax TaxID=35708 RepID=A0A0A9G9T5_ARUDO
MMRPYWPKTCYRQGAAFMLLKVKATFFFHSILVLTMSLSAGVYIKDYEKACDALKLDPTNVEIQNALRECREVTKNAGTEK